ncbi:MAG: Cys-Cys-COOH (seleno)protein SaoC [Eubacteriales bacterium]|nr:Cys-Cys-COOH (seleno)protein SaoC [Eubacteriales bacterium]
MKKMMTFFKSFKGRAVLIAVIFLTGFFIRTQLDHLYDVLNNIGTGETVVYDGESDERVGRELDYAENVPDDNKILMKFKELYPDAKILVACEEDLTNDGCKDLVLVVNNPHEDEHSANTQLIDGGYIRLCVMVDSGDGENYECSELVPAPVENQRIKFQNIDEQEEIEFVLQGQKGSKIGYGIFRVMEGEPVSLFDQGMEEC